jgi:hypothetical protein
VHREQGATAERSHHLAEGGGRELAYVAMSRARGPSTPRPPADALTPAARRVVPGGGSPPSDASLLVLSIYDDRFDEGPRWRRRLAHTPGPRQHGFVRCGDEAEDHFSLRDWGSPPYCTPPPWLLTGRCPARTDRRYGCIFKSARRSRPWAICAEYRRRVR